MDALFDTTAAAAIFWSYILATLILTSLAIFTITSIKIDPKTEDYRKKRQDARVFTVLALISFATISYNMLQILIQSYTAHATKVSWPALLLDDPIAALTRLWHWSTESTPFVDFGNAIAGDDFGWLWSQTSLLKTFSVCLYMAYEAPRLAVPNVWVFFGLAQLLPVSFALNLFYLAQIRLPKKPHYPTVTLTQPTIYFTVGVYCACLFAAPYVVGTTYILPTILLARLMLVVPLCFTKSEYLAVDHPNPEGANFGLYTAQVIMESAVLVMTAIQCNTIVQRDFEWWEVAQAVFSHPAVTTLGVDLIFSLVSYGIWLGIQRHKFPEDEEPPADEKVF